MLELPTREWLQAQIPGGIAPEYGIVMLDKIEVLEWACVHMLEDMESLGLNTEGYHESMDEAREALK